MFQRQQLRILILTFSILLSFAFSERGKDIIYWQAGRKLTWSDFKETKGSGNTGAVSSTGFGYKLRVEGQKVEVTIQSFFNRKESWVRKGEKHDKGLKHEQGHFDISEIFARKFRKHLNNYNFNYTVVDNEIAHVYRQYVKQLDAYQDLYDKETDHHRNDIKQMEWDDRIEKELNGLQNYSGIQLKVSSR